MVMVMVWHWPQRYERYEIGNSNMNHSTVDCIYYTTLCERRPIHTNVEIAIYFRMIHGPIIDGSKCNHISLIEK